MTRSGIWRALAFAVILVSLTTGWGVRGRAAAPEPQPQPGQTSVRSANHSGFGRIVIDTNRSDAYHIEQDGDHVVVRFAGAITLGAPPASPRNVIAIKTDGSMVDLTLKHGAQLHPMRLEGRVVLDIQDTLDGTAPPAKTRQGSVRLQTQPRPPLSMASSPELDGGGGAGLAGSLPVATAKPGPRAAQPLPPPPPAQSMAMLSTPDQSTTAQSPAGMGLMEAAQQMLGRDVLPENQGPVRLLARRVKLPTGVDGTAFLVPFASTTGAASFRTANSTYVVFDERRPVDMSALRSDPVFSAASVHLLPNGTLFRIPLLPTQSMGLTQMPQGWRIAALTAALKQEPITVSYTDGVLNMAAEQSSAVLSLADPDTGATLLIGTQHRPGQGLAITRRSAEFILRPTIQGVAVEPLSDVITLKMVPTGFILSGATSGL
jgi:hypothetical protein